MYIELTGLPGSGKTYLSQLLFARHKGAGYYSANNGTRARILDSVKKGPLAGLRTGLLGAARFATVYPDTYRYLSDPRSVEGSSLLWPTLFMSNYFFADHYWRNTGVIVADEGFVQFAVAASVGKPEEEWLAYIDSAPKIDALVVADVDVDTLLERMSARPRGLPRLLRNRSTEEVEAYFAHSRRVMEVLSERCAERGTHVMRINAAEPADVLVPQIHEMAQSLKPA
jgi:thymidylate kinase